MVDLIGTECGCEEHVKIFKAKGIWIEDGTIVPKPGYIILYNWDQGYQPNDGYSDHIGVVESVSNGQITCIEGNKGEAVARRVLSVGNGNIRGYAVPKYDSQGTAPSNPPAGGLDGAVPWLSYFGTAYPLIFPFPTERTRLATASPLLPSIQVICPLDTDSTTPI